MVSNHIPESTFQYKTNFPALSVIENLWPTHHISANNAARLAVQYGAAGIVVSNHGARQLDYVPATIMALEEVHLLHS